MLLIVALPFLYLSITPMNAQSEFSTYPDLFNGGEVRTNSENDNQLNVYEDLLNSGRIEEAKAELERLILIHGETPVLVKKRANLYERIAGNKSREGAYRTADRYMLSSRDQKSGEIRKLIDSAEYDAALEQIHMLEKSGDRDPVYEYLRSLIFVRKGDLCFQKQSRECAVENYNSALLLWPDNPDIMHKRDTALRMSDGNSGGNQKRNTNFLNKNEKGSDSSVDDSPNEMVPKNPTPEVYVHIHNPDELLLPLWILSLATLTNSMVLIFFSVVFFLYLRKQLFSDEKQ